MNAWPYLVWGVFLGYLVITADGEEKISPSKNDPPEGSTLSAVNSSIVSVLETYQELTGKTVIEDSNLTANAVPITIMVPTPVPRGELVHLIEAALLLNNYAFVPGSSENTVKVINLNTGKNPRSEGVRLYTTPDSLPEGEQIVSYYMPLSHISAAEAVGVFQTHVLPRAYTAFVPINGAQAVLITENTSVIKELISVKQLIDVPPAATATEFVQLVRADAERVADSITKLLENQQKSQSPTTPQGVPAAAGAGSVSGISGWQAQLVADARTNRIVVVSRPENMSQLRAFIEAFDQPNAAERPLEYRLRYVAAGDVLPVLKDLLTEGGQQDQGQGGGATGAGNQQNQQRSVSGSTSTRSSSTSSGSNYTGSTSSSASGNSQGGQDLLQDPNETLGPQSIVVGKTRVISDAQNNKIIVIGPPESIQKVRLLLDRLDQRPQQVYLAVVIGQLELDNETDFGVDFAETFKKLSGNSGIAASNLNSSGILNSNNQIVSSASQILSTASVPGLSGLTLYGKIGDALNVFVRATDTRSHFTILARPTVYTANNKRAVIASGQRVPVAGSTLSNVTSSTSSSSTAAVESTVEYEDVELRLEVIPLINSNGEVTLKIAQINDSLGNTVTISGNTYNDINSQRLTTTVTIPSGATVVLGGLIQDNIKKSDNGLPYLDNVPYLGKLFKYQTRIKDRTELLVFIQPTIVGSETDTYRASLKEEKRSMVGAEMSQLAHPNDYAQPAPAGKKSKYQK